MSNQKPECPQTELELVETPAPKSNEEKLQELIERCNIVLEKVKKRRALKE